MSADEHVRAGVRNASARVPAVDAVAVERRLRKANRVSGRNLGRIEWSGSLRGYIRRLADLMIEGWTLDYYGPLTPPLDTFTFWTRGHGRLDTLAEIEHELWSHERAAHSSALLSPSKRLPVYLNAIEAPQFATRAAAQAVGAAALAVQTLESRERTFAADNNWKGRDSNWARTRGAVALPFLTAIASCFADGLFAAALLRRGTSTRTILIARPRLRTRGGLLHAPNAPAVVWPDGSTSWYWHGIAVPEQIAAARDRLTAQQVAQIGNQELRRVTLERLGWDRFLETADAELRAQDDYGKLWTTKVRLDGERVQLVEVVNATAEPDGSHRRYVLRVPPNTRSAREAIAWTFGFNNADDYILAAAS